MTHHNPTGEIICDISNKVQGPNPIPNPKKNMSKNIYYKIKSLL